MSTYSDFQTDQMTLGCFRTDRLPGNNQRLAQSPAHSAENITIGWKVSNTRGLNLMSRPMIRLQPLQNKSKNPIHLNAAFLHDSTPSVLATAPVQVFSKVSPKSTCCQKYTDDGGGTALFFTNRQDT